MSTRRRASSLTVLFLSTSLLAACVDRNDSANRESGDALTYASKIADSIDELRPIIEDCDGGGAVLADLTGDYEAFKSVLNDPTQSDAREDITRYGNHTTIDIDAAYEVAVKCGTADPQTTSLAQWHATYWDFSSP